MSAIQMDTAPHWRQIGLWLVKALLAAAFLAAGGAKLYGLPVLVQMFEQIRLGQWFRYLTGALEVIGAVAVVIPATAGFGAALLATIMIGAMLTHLLVLPGSPIPAIVLFTLSAAVIWAHRDQIMAFAGNAFAPRA
jgi:putative oxidoreductase